jgi:hypothetical protein
VLENGSRNDAVNNCFVFTAKDFIVEKNSKVYKK